MCTKNFSLESKLPVPEHQSGKLQEALFWEWLSNSLNWVSKGQTHAGTLCDSVNICVWSQLKLYHRHQSTHALALSIFLTLILMQSV